MNPIHFFDHIFTYKTNFSDSVSQSCRPFSFNILLVNTVCTAETPTVSCPRDQAKRSAWRGGQFMQC